jgi:hypothetical protein
MRMLVFLAYCAYTVWLGECIHVATQGNPTGAEYDLFASNAFVIRTEVRMGVGVLRPQAFAVVSLGGGS